MNRQPRLLPFHLSGLLTEGKGGESLEIEEVERFETSRASLLSQMHTSTPVFQMSFALFFSINTLLCDDYSVKPVCP